MIKLFRIILYFIVFIYSLIIFLPKENLFFYIINQLENEKIFLNYTKSEDKFLKFRLDNIEIEYDDIKIAQISKIKIENYFFYNQITIKNIISDNSLQTFIPRTISNIKVIYSILDPLDINIKIDSRLANAIGTIDIINKKLSLVLNISKKFQKRYPMIIKNLKFKEKTNKGGKYSYEYNF